MPAYRCSTDPVHALSTEDLLQERGDLKVHLTQVYGDLAVKKAWAQAEQRTQDPEHLASVARAQSFRARLEVRHAQVHEELRRRRAAT